MRLFLPPTQHNLFSYITLTALISAAGAAALPTRPLGVYMQDQPLSGSSDNLKNGVKDYMHLKYNARVCNLGVSTKSRKIEANPKGVWEGFPIGAYLTGTPIPDNICYSTHTMGAGFVNNISSFVVAGYCECVFYGDSECRTPLLEAYNTQQPDLRNIKKGEIETGVNLDDRFNSFSCRWTNRTESFESCTVNINNDAKPDGAKKIFGTVDGTGYVEQTETFSKEDMKEAKDLPYDSEPISGITRCVNVNSNIRVRAWEINGCTCEFFDATDCRGTRIYQKGVPGRDVGTIENEDVVSAKSFRCWLPFGVAWGKEREDSVRIIDAIDNLVNLGFGPEAPQLVTATPSSLLNPPMATWVAGATGWGVGGIAAGLTAVASVIPADSIPTTPSDSPTGSLPPGPSTAMPTMVASITATSAAMTQVPAPPTTRTSAPAISIEKPTIHTPATVISNIPTQVAIPSDKDRIKTPIPKSSSIRSAVPTAAT
ncbi:hypothetical protein TWF718_008322 [Orbilia javanica]|uniref:Uncharacterized protein n=1 Tax=Orbilia javanica TaxID=47235 RepID=A0AAN8RMT9_9PEZI